LQEFSKDEKLILDQIIVVMKWAREIKIGLLSILVVVILYWGYKFLIGKNVFADSATYKITYSYIDQLTVSSPVMVRGFKVGMVTKIYLNPDNVDEVIVEIEVDGEIKLPRETRAILYSVGIVGGKGIILQFDQHCKEDCIPSGSSIQGEVRGLLTSMVPETEIDLYLSKLQSGLGGMLDSIGLNGDGQIDQTTFHIKSIIANLASITQKLDQVVGATNGSIEKSISDIQSFTGTLKQNEEHLNKVLENLDRISSQLADAGLDRTIVKIDSTIGDLSVSVGELKAVMRNAGNSFENIDQMVSKIENGEGTLGKLISQDSVYSELSTTITHLNLLLQDIRLNPKRYVNVSIIGRKDKPYEKAEDDPALSPEKSR